MAALAGARLDADLILVGGGLANGLIAWRLRERRPDWRVLLLEQGSTLGGNHTWSFHAGDLTVAQHAWIEPLVAHRWPSHSVRFPARARILEGGYASISSQRFAAVLGAALDAQARTETPVRALTPTGVELEGGTRLCARAVIDGRGVRTSTQLRLGFQKFLGREVRTAAPHGLAAPLLMDATVQQREGYRFVYVLPLSANTLLIEDTFYSDDAALDAAQLRRNIDGYALAQGWRIQSLLREEHGVLPIVLGGDFDAFWREAQGVPRSGLSAGLFHPTTGYSLPEAVALADLICDRFTDLSQLTAAALFKAIRAHALARWRDNGFFRLLNRMLFEAARPGERWRVMQRFYGLPEPLIARFYAARLTPLDKLRILTGRPPVPLRAALQAALERR